MSDGRMEKAVSNGVADSEEKELSAADWRGARSISYLTFGNVHGHAWTHTHTLAYEAQSVSQNTHSKARPLTRRERERVSSSFTLPSSLITSH